MRLLLIEDDVDLAHSLLEQFRDAGYEVAHAVDGKDGLARALDEEFQAIVVDRMLPGMNGLELVKALRLHKATPAIYLTTMGGIDDRVLGLEAGADDYLVKPFAMAELLARIRVMTRRSPPVTSVLRAGCIELNLLQRTVTRHGRTVDLLPQEFRLLEYLVRNVNRAVTRKMLLENVWDIHFDPNTSVVESHVSRLRARLNANGDADAIQTVRGVGYRLIELN